MSIDMPYDQQLKRQLYNYFKDIGWADIPPLEEVWFLTLVDRLYRRAQVLELDVATRGQIIAALHQLRQHIHQLHSDYSNLVEFLDDGFSIYDEEVDSLLDSMWAEFAQILHILDTETQTAKEHPAGSEKE